jgi:23S rRNA (uracil1939-C5)-methyltransferase
VDVRIDKWVYGGAGLARTDGRVTLTPFVLPGERARVKLHDGVRADLIEVLEPSAERVAPPCPLFGRCGGCHYQHAPYEYQVARKVEILHEQLRRVGKIEYDGEIATVTGEPLGYRNRIQLHVENGQIGYIAARSHDLVPLTGDCPIASPRLNQALAVVRERIHDPRWPKFAKSIELFSNEREVQINVLDTEKPVAKRFFEWMESVAAIEYPTSLGMFRVSPRSFFQVNRFLIERLVEVAIGDATGDSALDLYAGAGLFAIPLARRFGEVTAVEAGSAAVRDLESAPELVLADPPRAGLGKTVTAQLTRLAPQRIVIVSCDPATLARDLAALSNYRIEKMTLVDLFPQTYHLETVVSLRLIE